MRVVDANLLIYAFNANAPEHVRALGWLDEARRVGDLAITDIVTVAFARIVSNRRLLPAPIEAATAVAAIRDMFAAGAATRLLPGAAHLSLLSELCESLQLSGNDVNDAYLAALAMENDATLCSADGGFARFPGLKILNPLAGGPV